MEFYTWIHMDFAIPIMVWTWHGREFLLKESDIVPDSSIISKFVCFLSKSSGSASGTVISMRDQPIFVGGKSVRHLILTAGHYVGTKLSSGESDSRSAVHFESDTTSLPSYRAELLCDFSSWTEVPLLDSKSGYPYPLSNDLAILAMEKCDRLDLVEVPIAHSVSKDEKVIVAGYPKAPTEILYTAPILRNADASEYKKKIYSAFHNFQCRVSSEGEVLSDQEVNYALCANYSSTSGQSGGPVLRLLADGTYELVGINIAGATLPTHWLLGQVISKVIESDWAAAQNYLETVISELATSNAANYDKIKGYVNFLKDRIEANDPTSSVTAACALMNVTAAWYEKPNELDHNLAFPCYHPVMSHIKEVCRRFKLLPNAVNFASYADLWTALTNEDFR